MKKKEKKQYFLITEKSKINFSKFQVSSFFFYLFARSFLCFCRILQSYFGATVFLTWQTTWNLNIMNVTITVETTKWRGEEEKEMKNNEPKANHLR